MWPFKSKYDKLKREDVVNAICELENEESSVEHSIVENAKQVDELMKKGAKESNRDLKLFYAKKITSLKEQSKADVQRGMYLLYNIKLMNRLKQAIDDNNFFAKTGNVSLGNLLKDQKGLAVFLNKALNTKIKGENVLTAADETWMEVQSSYEENEAIYGVGDRDDELLAMFETENQLNDELGVEADISTDDLSKEIASLENEE